ncbi:MAG: efflux RND transporter permease subunit [Ferruginibacter sp.]
MMEVDDEKAKQLGVSVSDLLQTLHIYYGSSFVSDFNRFGKYYRVTAQADAPYRANPESLNSIYIKSTTGQMVPANALVTLHRVYGPETVTRNNLYNAVTIMAYLNPAIARAMQSKQLKKQQTNHFLVIIVMNGQE